jgi:hypothetical protein
MILLELELEFEIKRVPDSLRKFEIDVPGCSLRLKKDRVPD